MNTIAPRGLENVVAADSALADVDGTAGTLRLRGYDIADLAQHTSFEEVLALLWDGELPSEERLAALRKDSGCAGSNWAAATWTANRRAA